MAISSAINTQESEFGKYCESGRYQECPLYNNYLLAEEKAYKIPHEPTAGGTGKMSA
ncbi:MAG: hypothetical protein R6V10_14620 [bacterium]